MRLLMVGDVVGAGGREILARWLPRLRDRLRLDFVAVNGENAAHGRGITTKMVNQFLDLGADVITLGNHAFDEPEVLLHFDREPRLLRPVNIARRAPGAGARVFVGSDGARVLVINALGRKFMDGLYGDPFEAVDEELESHRLGRDVEAAILDFHAETTSEKMAMGLWCDGRLSIVAGTHTHVPTADARILPGGTAYVTDLGMCGSYDSVIGVRADEPIHRFTTGMKRGKFDPETRNPTFCGIFVETDDRTGLGRRVSAVRLGGSLEETLAVE